MFQKTLNTTKYSLSPSLSFLLLSYDQKGHQSKYKLINLKKRLEYSLNWELPTHFKHFMFQCKPSWVSPGWRLHKQSCLGDRHQPHPTAWKKHLLHGKLIKSFYFYFYFGSIFGSILLHKPTLKLLVTGFMKVRNLFGFLCTFCPLPGLPCLFYPICFYNEMNLVFPSLNSLCMQPDVNSNNSEELLKSTEETLTLTLDKQYEGKNKADNEVIKGLKKVVHCPNVV